MNEKNKYMTSWKRKSNAIIDTLTKMEEKNMEKIIKLTIILLLIFISIIGIIQLFNIETQNKVYAANSSSSDLQLMARAINGEARGEPYEGQVAVRSSYPKSCQKFQISKHNSRSYL